MTRCSGVPEPDDGSQPRYTEKNRIISRPTQNDGMLRPSRANTLPAPSPQPLTRTAASTPLGMPIRSENTIAVVARSNEWGRRER